MSWNSEKHYTTLKLNSDYIYKWQNSNKNPNDKT